jgi:hypothetical protein
MVVFQRSGGMVQSVRDNEVVSIARTVKQVLDAAEANAGLSRPVGSGASSIEIAAEAAT